MPSRPPQRRPRGSRHTRGVPGRGARSAQHSAVPVPGGGVRPRSASTPKHNGEREGVIEYANAFCLQRTCSEIAFIRPHTRRQADAPQPAGHRHAAPSRSAGPGRALSERRPRAEARGQNRRAAPELPATPTGPGPRRQADRGRPHPAEPPAPRCGNKGTAASGRRRAETMLLRVREARRAPRSAARPYGGNGPRGRPARTHPLSRTAGQRPSHSAAPTRKPGPAGLLRRAAPTLRPARAHLGPGGPSARRLRGVRRRWRQASLRGGPGAALGRPGSRCRSALRPSPSYSFPLFGDCLFIFASSKSHESPFDLQPVPGETGDPNERADCKGN